MTKKAKSTKIAATFEPEYTLVIEGHNAAGYYCDEVSGDDIDELIECCAKSLTDDHVLADDCSFCLSVSGGEFETKIGKEAVIHYMDNMYDVSVMSETEVRKRIKASKHYKVKPQSTSYKMEQLAQKRAELELQLARVIKQMDKLKE
jgi:hypothetical protein